MPSDRYEQQRNALIQAKVDRAVARWKGLAPPHMIAKTREIAEDYYRTHPFAVRVIDLLVQPHTRDTSGVEGVHPLEEGDRLKKGNEGR